MPSGGKFGRFTHPRLVLGSMREAYYVDVTLDMVFWPLAETMGLERRWVGPDSV
jgi:hypothetical protein